MAGHQPSIAALAFCVYGFTAKKRNGMPQKSGMEWLKKAE